MTVRNLATRFAQLAIGVFVMAFPSPSQGASEYRVKALFIYNVAKFVEWPAEAFSDIHQPINVCIVGEDPFGSEMDDAIRGKKVNARDVLVRRIASGEEPRNCQVLFLGAEDRKSASKVLAEIGMKPILTVKDSANVAKAHAAAITLGMEGSKVRFDIDLQEAGRAHLKISSKLLSLARSVKEPADKEPADKERADKAPEK